MRKTTSVLLAVLLLSAPVLGMAATEVRKAGMRAANGGAAGDIYFGNTCYTSPLGQTICGVNSTHVPFYNDNSVTMDALWVLANKTGVTGAPYLDNGTWTNDNNATFYSRHPIPVLNVSDNTTLTAAQGYGTIVWVSAARTITLPAVAAGMSVCVQAIGAVAVTVDPNASDGIRLNGGARDTDGHYIQSSGTAGDMICVVGDSADGWTTTGRAGTWTAE